MECRPAQFVLHVQVPGNELITSSIVRDWLHSQINDWFGAAKKTLLSNANKLLQDMQEFDKDNIPDKVISVRKEYNHTHSTPKRV